MRKHCSLEHTRVHGLLFKNPTYHSRLYDTEKTLDKPERGTLGSQYHFDDWWWGLERACGVSISCMYDDMLS